ncbi:PWI domain-containing protein, partial [Naematelia encephala]
RFKDKEAAAVKATKFPKSFNEKVCFETAYIFCLSSICCVDLRKVNLSVLRPWIAQKITELIRFEDDVVVEYVYGMLEDKEKPNPDPKKMQVSLLGFMDKYGAAAFMEALWNLLLSAQNTVGGVPAEVS